MRWQRLWACMLALSGVLSASCGDRDGAAASSASAKSAPPAPSTAVGLPTSSAPSAEEETSTRPLELLKFQFTSEVKDRAPADKLELAQPGKRVYAHLTLRNRSGHSRKVHLTFSVGEVVRTELDLEVGDSWSWRTWGYNTVLAGDAGKKLTLVVVDDEGHPLVDESLPIAR